MYYEYYDTTRGVLCPPLKPRRRTKEQIIEDDLEDLLDLLDEIEKGMKDE